MHPIVISGLDVSSWVFFVNVCVDIEGTSLSIPVFDNGSSPCLRPPQRAMCPRRPRKPAPLKTTNETVVLREKCDRELKSWEGSALKPKVATSIEIDAVQTFKQSFPLCCPSPSNAPSRMPTLTPSNYLAVLYYGCSLSRSRGSGVLDEREPFLCVVSWA